MTLIKLQLKVVLSSLVACLPLCAQQSTLEIVPTQTRIEFTLGSFLHTVHGTFRLKSGTVRFDPASGEAGGLVIVDATSGDTGNRTRDRKMHREVLESARYPEIAFIPVAVHGQISLPGESQIEIRGVLRVHGDSHDVSLPATVRISGNRLTAEIHFAVPYKEWGIRDPSAFMLRVSDKVDVAIYAVANMGGQ